MTNKRWMAFTLIASMLLTIFAGCSPGNDGAKEEEQIQEQENIEAEAPVAKTTDEETEEASGASGTEEGVSQADGGEAVELMIFAAASMTESLQQIAEMYKNVEPNLTLTFNFDSSGTLKTQIEEGAPADIFISAGKSQMDGLDLSADEEANPNKLDIVDQETRFDLLTNTVVMVVPKGSDKGITSFEDAASDKVSLMALGNSDVPVGQYAQDVFTYLNLWDQLNSESKITFASNVKEVLEQVEADAVDCGVVYISDAVTSDDVEVVAKAPEGSHKPVNYPAAVLKTTGNKDAALAFLEYLKGTECTAVFKDIGFDIPAR